MSTSVCLCFFSLASFFFFLNMMREKLNQDYVYVFKINHHLRMFICICVSAVCMCLVAMLGAHFSWIFPSIWVYCCSF